MAEFSLIRIRRTKLEELSQNGNSSATRALYMVNSLDAYISASQLGVTLSSLGLGWIGEPAIATVLEYIFGAYISGTFLLHTISFAVGFSIITFLHIVIGEMLPRSIAIQITERTALLTAMPLYCFHKITYPLIYIFNGTAKNIARLIGIKVAEGGAIHSEEELRMIVTESHKGGAIDTVESELIDNVFDFADRTAREVMISRQDMVCLFVDDTFEKNMHTVRTTNHTRYPLCIKDRDHVIGMIHLRDLITIDLSQTTEFDLQTIMRKIIMIPESMPASQILQEMRRRQTHLSVVIDEYGGTAGIVAMEDVIEEIIGDIKDEHDVEVEAVQLLSDGSYEIDGTVLVEDVIELLELNLSEPDEDTIGGYVFALLGRRPEINDVVVIENYEFIVTQTIGFRVKSLNVKSIASDEKSDDSEATEQIAKENEEHDE